MTTRTLALPATPCFHVTDVARYGGLPLLLAVNAAVIAWTLTTGFSMPLASVFMLFGSVAYLLLMERWIPFRRDWQPAPREWRRDGIYFVVNGLLSVVPPALVGAVAIHLAPGHLAMGLGTQIPLAILVAGFAGYWTHRLGHTVHALWALHGVHHTPDKVNAWNNNVVHAADLTFQNTTSLGALVLVGFSPEAVFAATAYGQAMSFADHANADFRIGWFNLLIGSPEQHRLHHSVDVEEAGHYSVLPLWDLVFGTFTWRPGREPRAVGIEKPETFPQPDAIGRNFVHPFRAWFRRS